MTTINSPPIDWEIVKTVNGKAERFLSDYFKPRTRFVTDLNFSDKEFSISYTFNGDHRFSILDFLNRVKEAFKDTDLVDTMITMSNKGTGFVFIFTR
jgi:hypothetical protein